MLDNFGYTAKAANNGLEVLDMLHSEGFDLVLMDVQMPEMDGLEATTMIRGSDSDMFNADIPIIAMTANAMVGDREMCIKAGMNDYLSKPIDQQALRKKIEYWLKTGHNKVL